MTSFPLWQIFLSLFIGAGFALFLYVKEHKNEYSITLKIILAILRGLASAILVFLIFSPLIRSNHIFEEKPIILFAIDNSESIIKNKDSLYFKDEFHKVIEQTAASFDENYDVRIISFDKEVNDSSNFEFNGKETNIYSVIEELESVYGNRNIGALILASDGIFNRGLNPLYSGIESKFPIYTIALGDTSIRKDLKIKNIYYNDYAISGNQFNIEILIEAQKCGTDKSVLTVWHENKELHRQIVSIANDNQIFRLSLPIEAIGKGMQCYTAKLSPLKNEISIENNSKNIYIEIIDDKQNILLLANEPHPDISALKSALNGNKSFQIESFLYSDFNSSIKKYDLVILHNLPSSKNNIAAVIKESENNNIPLMFIVGAGTNINILNSFKLNISILIKSQLESFVKPIYNTSFSSFFITEDLNETLKQFPPLNSGFCEYQNVVIPNILLYQVISNVQTSKPLIYFDELNNLKYGYIMGEGIWRWKLADFRINNNNQHFIEFFSKILQFLSNKSDKSLFRLQYPSSFYENQSIEINALLYNENYEPIKNAEISLHIFNNNFDRKYSFSYLNDKFLVNAGFLPPGEYKMEANAKYLNISYSKKAYFTVKNVNVEMEDLVANHLLLYNLAVRSGGMMFKTSQLNEIPAKILQNDSIVAIRHNQIISHEVIYYLPLLIILILLLAVEWLLRKRSGAY